MYIGRLLSFMISNVFSVKRKSASVGKILKGGRHWQSHNIPLSLSINCYLDQINMIKLTIRYVGKCRSTATSIGSLSRCCTRSWVCLTYHAYVFTVETAWRTSPTRLIPLILYESLTRILCKYSANKKGIR